MQTLLTPIMLLTVKGNNRVYFVKHAQAVTTNEVTLPEVRVIPSRLSVHKNICDDILPQIHEPAPRINQQLTTNMPPSVSTMRRKYRLSRQQRQPFGELLTPIPEDKSCREWFVAAVNLSSDEQAERCYALIEQERLKRNLSPLQRSDRLHKLAKDHANAMAKKTKVFHSVANLAQLQLKLDSNMVGENVQRGDDEVEMHRTCMSELEVNRSNILGHDFVEFAVAVAPGDDGKLYMVQYFR